MSTCRLLCVLSYGPQTRGLAGFDPQHGCQWGFSLMWFPFVAIPPCPLTSCWTWISASSLALSSCRFSRCAPQFHFVLPLCFDSSWLVLLPLRVLPRPGVVPLFLFPLLPAAKGLVFFPFFFMNVYAFASFLGAPFPRIPLWGLMSPFFFGAFMSRHFPPRSYLFPFLSFQPQFNTTS